MDIWIFLSIVQVSIFQEIREKYVRAVTCAYMTDSEDSCTMGSQSELPPEVSHNVPVASTSKRLLAVPLNLEALLKETINGQAVLSYYKSNHSLSEGMRTKLGDVIISDHLKKNVYEKMPADDICTYTAEIIRVFPTEIEETWKGIASNQRDKSIGRGKLLTRFYMRRTMKKCGLMQTSSKNKKIEEVESEDESDTDNVEEGVNDAIEWLKNNSKPWTQVIEFWETTSKTRIKLYLKEDMKPYEYMDLYPALKDKSGYLLLEIDNEKLHAGTSMKLYSEWPMLSAFIISKLPLSDKNVIEESLTSSAKQARTLLALNKLFPVITAIKKGKNQWKPSRLESRESFLLLVKGVADVEETLNERRAKYEKFHLNLSPQAIIVGQDEDFITQCYVIIDQVIYKMESPMKAIDIAFKAMNALDSSYPKECCREWLFLQIAVYGFKTKHDSVSMDAKCATLIEEYKAFKSCNK